MQRLPYVENLLLQYDNQTYSGQRKMLALGLTSLVKTTNATVLSRMDEIIGVWLSALSETRENEHGESVALSLQRPDVSTSFQKEVAAWSSSSSSWHLIDHNNECVEEQLWPEGTANAGYASSSQATISSRTNSIATTTTGSPILSPVWSGTVDLPEMPLSDGLPFLSHGQDMMMDQAQANSGAGGGVGADIWPLTDTMASPSHTVTPTFAAAVVDDHNAAWGIFDSESPIKPTFDSDSADGYYDNDEQVEAFEMGWGEVEGDPGLKRLHGVSTAAVIMSASANRYSAPYSLFAQTPYILQS
jgi:hypothetical protein